MIKNIIIIMILIYIVIGLVLYIKQRDFLYFPTENTKHTEEDIFLKNQGCKIHIIKINDGKENAIIYFGGNAEIISNSIDYIKKQFPEETIYMMNYRGYGLSNCRPTEKGIYSDAIILYDYIKKNHKKISVGGRSIGSGVASYLAGERKVDNLVLITPYNSIIELAQKKYWMYPLKFMMKDKFESGKNVKKFKTRTLLAIAEKDTIIPMSNTKKLIDKFPKEQVEILIIKDANHINISESEEYFLKVRDFVEKGSKLP